VCVLQSDVVSTKDWILQYAECQTDSDDEEFVHDGEQEACVMKCQELDDGLDPVL